MSAGTGSVGGAVLAVDEAPNPWFDPSYVVDNWDTILRYLGEHVRLTVGAVVLGALIALPLALLARRSRYLAGPVLAVSTIVYTIPSLAMFAFIFPFTGLSATTVLIGLVALLAGHPGAQLPHRAAGRARPTSGRPRAAWATARLRLFWQIDLPLALPAFMAGLRIATVSTVALVTVGVLVGHGGLGPADHRRVQRQLLPGGDRHRHGAAASCWPWSPTCCWPASNGWSPPGRGRSRT